MSIFEKATRKKLRFNTQSGNVTTEDLWDMKLEGRVSLDSLARSLNKEIKEQQEESFVKKPSAASSETKLKFDVVKHVIDVKLADQDRAQKATKTRQEKQRILELMERKQGEELEGKSMDELKEMLDSLES